MKHYYKLSDEKHIHIYRYLFIAMLVSIPLLIIEELPLMAELFFPDKFNIFIPFTLIFSILLLWYNIKIFGKTFNVKKSIIYSTLFVLVNFLIILILQNFIEPPKANETQKIINLVMEKSPVVVFLSTSVFAPIFEENIFRGILLNTISNLDKKFTNFSYGKFKTENIGLIAMIITTLIFILAHSPNSIMSYVQYISLSLGLIIIRYKSNNLLTSILAHSCWNAITALMMYIN